MDNRILVTRDAKHSSGQLIMDAPQFLDHPFWGSIHRPAGCDDWNIEIAETLPDGTVVPVRFEFADPDDEVVQANFRAIRDRWIDIWSRILDRTAEMKCAYGYGDIPIRGELDRFELSLPKEPIGQDVEWSVMLQAEEAGWLLDFNDWDDSGEQGVF